MKTLSHLTLSSLLLVFLFTSCSKRNNYEAEAEKPNIEYLFNQMCCNVSCSGGKCKAKKTPCNCKCVGGMPNCTGGSAGISNFSDYDVVVEADDPAIYLYHDNLINYLTENNADQVAHAIDNIKNLLQNNNNIIWQGPHLDEYAMNINIWTTYYQQQTPEVQESLNEL